MKYWITVLVTILFLGLATGVNAQDKSKTKDAERRVKEQLPAEPPKETTGTVKGPTLSKPDPNRKPQPKEEPPPPKVEKKDTKKDQKKK